MRGRAAFLPALVTLAESRDPRIRAAAVAGLAGCRGVRGLQVIARALDDPEPAVWQAACAALAVTGASVPARLAHGLFHRSGEVRRHLLERGLPVAAAHLGTYLRADPACRDLAARYPWPHSSLGLAIELFEDGALEPGELLDRISTEQPAVVVELARRRIGRSERAVDEYLDRPTGELPGIDVFDAIAAALSAHPHRGAIAVLADATLGKNADRAVARRFAAAALAAPPIAAVTLELVAAIEPQLITWPRIATAANAPVIAAGLRRYRPRIRQLRSRQVRRLLERCPAVGDGAELDLDLAAAIAGLLREKRQRALQTTFGDEAIAAAIARSDRAWQSICELPRGDRPLWRRWLESIAAGDAKRARDLVALALWVWVRDRGRLDETVRNLDRRDRAAALLALARLAAEDRVELAPDRLSSLVEMIASRLIPSAAVEVAVELIEADTAEARMVAAALARELPARRLVTAVAELGAGPLIRFLEHIDIERLPWNRELALAKALASSDIEAARVWAAAVLATLDAPAPEAAPAVAVKARALTDDERDAISAAPETGLDAALAPALAAPSLGLVAALERRVPPSQPSVAAASALIASFDPLDKASLQLDRFATLGPDFVEALDSDARRWNNRDELPPLANALLFRWEKHNFALAGWIEARGGLLGRLHEIIALAGEVARHILWRGVAEVIVLLRYRDRPRLEAMVDTRVVSLLIGQFGGPAGRHAARALVAIFESGLSPLPLAGVREAIADRAADADRVTRAHLARLMRLDGLPPPASPGALVIGMRDRLEAIQSETDLDRLAEACRAPALRLVEEAVLRLMLLGRDGEAVLASLVGELALLPCPAPIIASIEMWSDESALASVRALARSGSAEIRMRVALALCARGEAPGTAEMAQIAVAAVRAPIDGDSWFGSDDWEALCRHIPVDELAGALIDAEHHRAYRPAFAHLITAEATPAVRDGLIRFLERGTDRPIGMRRTAARNLLATWSLPDGMPIVLEEYTDPSGSNLDLDQLPRSRHLERFVEAVVWMSLTGGHDACVEARAIDALRGGQLGSAATEPLWAALLEGSLLSNTRQIASQMLGNTARSGLGAGDKRRRVAESFAWGIRRGRELTGRLYRIHMTAAERAFGHTYLDEDRVFVSALPILRGERNGRDIVEGLILHELGHHVYHRGKRAAAIWKEAADRGLFSLLNLIADEHLERNLRAVDTRFGDRLKRLGAYAFRHAASEIALTTLLDCLGSRSAAALIGTPLELAYDEAAVRIHRGAVLAELDAQGHPLARFARALRLGLGNRDGDPLVAAALARFDRSFRRLDMDGLWALTLEIAEMFGGRVAVGDVFGGSEGMSWSERDREVFGAGVEDDDVQQEVERILDPRRARGPGAERNKKLAINVNPDEQFDRITVVDRISQDRERHREMVAEIKRHAARLRTYLTDLGLRYITVGKRVSGRHLDRTRIRALVTRGDPRILRTRQLRTDNDLFFGVAIDCSSSMNVGDNIGRAQRFGVLLAEAVRDLPGIDSRFFGFTDSRLYDAGDAGHCAVASLPCAGGNNDAAALLHLSEEAERSRRRARVLVMISDGLPTQCSVAALRALVDRLGRRQILCAQVAVRPLEEVCFPDYVLLDGGEIDAAVAGFGRMVGDLARRALGG
jgi:hypothetical protein